MSNLEAHTKANLIKQLQDMGIESSDSILVHSSMKKIGQVAGGADTVLDALSDYMAEGLLVFPTHTWSYINEKNPKFYVQDSPSCVGILPELFRKRRSEEHTSELQSRGQLVCRLLLEKKNKHCKHHQIPNT